MVNLQRTTLLAALLAATATLMFATSVPCDSGAPDIEISTLTGTNVCTLGNQTFSNFNVVSSSGFSSVDIGIDDFSFWDGTDANLIFDVKTVPPVLTNPGEYIFLTYDISSTVPMDDVSLNNFDGSGEVIYEDVCEGDTFAGNACGPKGTIVAHLVGLIGQPTSADFTPSDEVAINKALAFGDASLEQFENSVGEAPEPVLSGLIGIALIGIVCAVRRRNRSI